MPMTRNSMAAIAVSMFFPSSLLAQRPPVRAASLPGEYRLDLNVAYPGDGVPGAKLDVFARRNLTPTPVVIWWHGSNLDKEYIRLLIPPLLEMGFSVVVPQAPDSPSTSTEESAEQYTARVVAGRCALRWTHAHAADYGFDVNRVIVAGTSLGGFGADVWINAFERWLRPNLPWFAGTARRSDLRLLWSDSIA
jgi:acetyl esterase/lipase